MKKFKIPDRVNIGKKASLGILVAVATFTLMTVSVQAAPMDTTATEGETSMQMANFSLQEGTLAGMNETFNQNDVGAQWVGLTMKGVENNLTRMADNAQYVPMIAAIQEWPDEGTIIAQSGNDIISPDWGVSLTFNEDVIPSSIFAAEESLGGGLKIPTVALASSIAPTNSDGGDGFFLGSIGC